MTSEAEQLKEFFNYKISDLCNPECVQRLIRIGDEAYDSIESIQQDMLEGAETLKGDHVVNIYETLKTKFSSGNNLLWVAAALKVEDLETRWTALKEYDFCCDFASLSSVMKRIKDILLVLRWTSSMGPTVERDLSEYMRTGTYLEMTKEMVDFKNLLADIQAGQNTHGLIPEFPELFTESHTYKQSVFVCASSGSGKSQIPFTLCRSMPLFYFLEYAGHLQQSIYMPFEELSKEFQKVCENEIDRLKSSFPGFVKNRYRIFDFKDELLDIPLESVGFLFAAIKYSVGHMFYNSKNPEKRGNWLHAQIQVNPSLCENEHMSIKEFRIKIIELKRAHPDLLNVDPVIFLDECEASGDPEKIFVFKRNLIRRLGLVPILIGTDSKVLDVVGNHERERGSRATPDACCFVFTKLPLYPADLMDEKIDEIHEILTKSSLNDREKRARRQLINVVKECVREERPWFIDIALEWFAEIVGRPKLSCTAIFVDILERLQTHFKQRKDTSTLFLLGQLMYALNRRHKESGIDPDIQTRFIHSHLAYFGIKTRVNLPADPNIDDLITLKIDDLGNLAYHVDKNGDTDKMVACSYFASFASQPLSSLAFTGEHASMRMVALPDDKTFGARMSIYDALKDIKTCRMLKRSPIYLNRKFGGFELEAVSRCALVFTLSKNGFRGIGFFKWLPYYAAEFRKGKSYEKVKIRFRADLKRTMKNVRLPFCGPVSEEWHQGLKDFVETRCGAYIGMIHETEDFTTNYQETDSIVTVKDNKQCVLQLDCKNHRTKVDSPLLLDKIKFLKREPCRLNVIVAREYVGFLSIAKFLRAKKVKRVAVIGFEVKYGVLVSTIVYGDVSDADWIVFLLSTKDIQKSR